MDKHLELMLSLPPVAALAFWLCFLMIDWENKVNCYDQAGIVQIALCFEPSGGSDWIYMDLFGYIITTKLTGLEPSNNPFYKRDGTEAIIGNNDEKRTAFGSHTFLKVSSKSDQIADACCCPHVANETLDEYICTPIEQAGTGDNQTTLYGKLWSPGTKKRRQEAGRCNLN